MPLRGGTDEGIGTNRPHSKGRKVYKTRKTRRHVRKLTPFQRGQKFGSQTDYAVDQLSAHKPLKPHGAHPVFPSGGIKIRRHRRQSVGRFKQHKAIWQDPYPWIEGTRPEKLFFDALMEARIYFIFHGGNPPNVKQVVLNEPDRDIDFRLPEYKVIIDPYSPFAHSQLVSVQRDARKEAVFAAAGYTTYHPWAMANDLFVMDQSEVPVQNWRGSHWLRGQVHNSTAVHGQAMGALDALMMMPLIRQGERFPLTDPLDIAAKKLQGYRIGTHLGAGANAVALANATRRRPPKLTLKIR